MQQTYYTDYWSTQYAKKLAFWLHDGAKHRPHALLTSGKHSDGFFNSELVMEDALLLDEACGNLLELLKAQGLSEGISTIDRVVGPAMGAITLAHDLSRHISDYTGHTCLRAYTEKEEGTDGKRMKFKRTAIKPGERALIVEDVLTTGGSIELTANAITEAGGIVLPYVVILVNRSGLTEVGGKKIIALIDQPMSMWTEAECPLCKDGSKALRPKENENWAMLNAPAETLKTA